MEDVQTLKDLRIAINLSQKQVAERIGVTQSYYSKIESGRRQPSLKIINRLCELFGEQVLQILIARKILEE